MWGFLGAQHSGTRLLAYLCVYMHVCVRAQVMHMHVCMCAQVVHMHVWLGRWGVQAEGGAWGYSHDVSEHTRSPDVRGRTDGVSLYHFRS